MNPQDLLFASVSQSRLTERQKTLFCISIKGPEQMGDEGAKMSLEAGEESYRHRHLYNI